MFLRIKVLAGGTGGKSEVNELLNSCKNLLVFVKVTNKTYGLWWERVTAMWWSKVRISSKQCFKKIDIFKKTNAIHGASQIKFHWSI